MFYYFKDKHKLLEVKLEFKGHDYVFNCYKMQFYSAGVRNIVQGFLLGRPVHTISYTIPPLPTGPLQKRKLPDGQFCTV